MKRTHMHMCDAVEQRVQVARGLCAESDALSWNLSFPTDLLRNYGWAT